MFKERPDTKNLWCSLIPREHHSSFFNSNFSNWLLDNLQVQGLKWEGLSWNAVFIVICWWLWKQKNEHIFRNGATKIEVHGLRRYVRELVRAFHDEQADRMMKQEILIQWTPPSEGWHKLNTDSTAKGIPVNAACGGVSRDCQGKWVERFPINLGNTTALEAELWGLFYGLSLAWKKGSRRLMVELDSSTTIMLIHERVNPCYPHFTLIMSCRDLLFRDWIVKLEHIYREGSKVADKLANLEINPDISLHNFDQSPATVVSVFWEDFVGIAFPKILTVICNSVT